MYGSSFMTLTCTRRACSTAASDDVRMPLPRDETTPPVTKMYRVMMTRRDPNARAGTAAQRESLSNATQVNRSGVADDKSSDGTQG